ncbi:MAG: DNA double-strand break repair nuclease NurA [Balneola sp.]
MRKDSKELQSKVILHPDFFRSIQEVQSTNVDILGRPDFSNVNINDYVPSGVFEIIGNNIESIKCIPEKGREYIQSNIISGYDESKLKYQTLQGSADFISHTLMVFAGKNYVPVSTLTFYFYTKSKELSDRFDTIQYSEDINSLANYHYVTDRNKLLKEYSVKDSIVFIDGPLIGGNISSYNTALVDALHKKNVIPIFIVKNSDSSLITDNVNDLKFKYNSDLHWSYKFLNEGQRTNFFRYTDSVNPKNSKVYFYLKALNSSPQRIELHSSTFENLNGNIDFISDLIYYLQILNGDKSNPQIRPIYLAEKYCREVIKLSNTYKMIKESGLVPTMNQERFG